jgi:hypothetical protein
MLSFCGNTHEFQFRVLSKHDLVYTEYFTRNFVNLRRMDVLSKISQAAIFVLPDVAWLLPTCLRHQQHHNRNISTTPSSAQAATNCSIHPTQHQISHGIHKHPPLRWRDNPRPPLQLRRRIVSSSLILRAPTSRAFFSHHHHRHQPHAQCVQPSNASHAFRHGIADLVLPY